MQPSSALFQATCTFVIVFGTTFLKAEECLVRTFSFNDDHTLSCSELSGPVTICQNQSIPVDNPIVITKENEGEYYCCCGSDNCDSDCVSKVAYGEQTKNGSISSNLEFKWGDTFNIPCAYTPGALISDTNADDFYELKWIFTPKFEDGSQTLFPQAGNAQVHKFSLDKIDNTISADVFNPLKDQGIYTCTVERLKQNDSSSSSFTISVTETTDSSGKTSITSPPTLQITDGTAQFNCLVQVPSYKITSFLIKNIVDYSLKQQSIGADITDNSCTLEGNHTVTCASDGPTPLTLSCSYDTPYQINCSLVMRNLTEKDSSMISCYVAEDYKVASDLFMIFPGLPTVAVSTSYRHFLADSLQMPTIGCYIVSYTTPNVTWTVNDPLVSLQQPELIPGSIDGVYRSTLTVNKDILGFSDKVFTCTATNVKGSASDSLLKHVYLPLPRVSVYSSTFTFLAASLEMPTIECTIFSSTTPNVTWTVYDPLVSLQQPELIQESIEGRYNSTLTVNRDIMGSTDKVFICTAISVYGSANDIRWIYVSVDPPVVTIAAVDDSITLGFDDPLVLTCTTVSAIDTVLTWTHPMNQPLTPNITFDGAFTYNSTIMIPAVDLNDGGSYTCVGSNARGKNRNTVQVNITVPDPVVSVTPSTLNTPYDSSVTLVCEAVSFTSTNITWSTTSNITLPDPILSYQGDTVYNSTLILNQVTTEHSGAYSCMVTNTQSTVTDTTHLQVYVPLPEVSVVSSTIIFSAASLLMPTIECTIVSFTTPNVIWTVNDSLVSLQQPELIQESIDDVYSSTLTVNKDILGVSDKVFTCTATNVNGSASDSHWIEIVPPPVVSVESSTTYFIAASLLMPTIECTIFSFTTPNVIWTVNDPLVTLQQPELIPWNTDGFYKRSIDDVYNRVYRSTLTVNRDIMGSTDKVFTCTAISVNGSDSDSQKIQVSVEPPVVTIGAVDDSITLGFGDPLVLTCTTVSAINTVLTWTHPMNQPLTSNITFDGAFTYNSTIMIPAVDLNDGGSYTCVGSNARGNNLNTAQIDITVSPPVIQPIPSQTVTVASNVTFFCNTSSNISITSYQWSSDPMLTQCDDSMPNCILGLNEAVLTLLSVPDHFSTNLTCTVTDSEGQSSSTTTELIIQVTDTSKRIQLDPGSIAGIAIAGSVVIMFGLICCVTIPCLLQRKLKKLKSIESSLQASSFEMEDQKDLKIRTNAHLNKLNLLSCVIDPSDLKLMEKVGQGEFGIVYRGVLRNDSSIISVAIKTVRGLYSDSLLIDELFEEAEKMKSFDHLHVLSLTGVCVGLLESPCIVMPFMSNGSLLSYLRRDSADLTINEMVDDNLFNSVLKHLLSMCLQVAKGMDYLSQQKFIHRDLAARNCMLSSEGIIKIADFGLAEDIYTTEYFKQVQSSDNAESVKLPLKWMALESIHLGKFDEKTDVWSYGVLCWEVFNGGKTPYPGSTPREVVTMLDNGERLTKPTNAACTEEVFSIMLSCWEKSPECRPCFFELVENINKLLIPLADYLEMAPDFKING